MHNSAYDYEGKEILVVVIDRDDAWKLSRASSDTERQDIVNRSKVFVSGTALGLSLSDRDPLGVPPPAKTVSVRSDAGAAPHSSSGANSSSPRKLNLTLPGESPVVVTPAHAVSESVAPTVAPPATESLDPKPATAAPSQPDADRLSEKYQSQLAALAKDGATKFQLVDYSPPAFVVFHEQIALQMTLRNSIQFDPAKGSIYKRAAQSFDLFLATKLRDLSEEIPQGFEFQLFDFSVLNKLSPDAKGTSEAIEFICPRAALKQFVNAEITNQQLIDQSIVLVNGVRIALTLQLVE
jgi:hypothetical protein